MRAYLLVKWNHRPCLGHRFVAIVGQIQPFDDPPAFSMVLNHSDADRSVMWSSDSANAADVVFLFFTRDGSKKLSYLRKTTLKITKI
jgi:hypothetical protein